MTKLKFDRTVNLNLESSDTATVPNNEVWKGSLFTAGSYAEVNGKNIETKNNASVPVLTLGGVQHSRECVLSQGLRSRLLTNIFAKEVSLA